MMDDLEPDRQEAARRMRRRNRRLAAGIFLVPALMVGAAYAAVPLYDLFCRVTGYGGTTQVADAVGDEVLDREIRVRFVGRVDRGLPWRFAADQREEIVQVGAPSTILYSAASLAGEPTAGTAVYNVAPGKAGRYFVKVQCFCFDEQMLAPGEGVEMPVFFYIDPAIASDPNMDDVTTITLSYTFYPSESEALREAQEAYYRSVELSNAADPAEIDHDVAGLGAGMPEVTAR